MVVRCVLAALVLVVAAGCASQGKQSTRKELARQKWNAARSGVLYGLAKQQYSNGNIDDARKPLEEALTLNPDDPQLHILMVKLLIEHGNMEQAEKELQTSRKLAPNNAEVDYLCGVVYQRWQKAETALGYYTDASTKQPGELAYCMARAEMLVVLDRPSEALDLLREKMVHFENSAAIRDAVGQLLVQQGKFREGAAVLQQACILGPDEPNIRERLALALFYAREYREALPLLERLVQEQKNSRRAELLLALGECQLQTGRVREARDTFQGASELDPNSVSICLSMAKTAAQLDDLKRAEGFLRRAMVLEPQSSEVYLMLGYIRLRQEKLDEAVVAFRKASLLDGDDPVSLCMTGVALEKQGKQAEAVDCYARAMELKPNDELAGMLIGQSRVVK